MSHWLYQERYLVPVVRKLTNYWEKQAVLNNTKVRPIIEYLKMVLANKSFWDIFLISIPVGARPIN